MCKVHEEVWGQREEGEGKDLGVREGKKSATLKNYGHASLSHVFSGNSFNLTWHYADNLYSVRPFFWNFNISPNKITKTPLLFIKPLHYKFGGGFAILNKTKREIPGISGHERGYQIQSRPNQTNPELAEPNNKKDILKLTGRLVALARYISKDSEKFQPFFKALKKSKVFERTEKCKKVLADIKDFLTSPSILAKPNGEKLYLYVVHSGISVIVVLV